MRATSPGGIGSRDMERLSAWAGGTGGKRLPNPPGATGGSVGDTIEGNGWATLNTGSVEDTSWGGSDCVRPTIGGADDVGRSRRGTEAMLTSPGSTPNEGDPMEDAGKRGGMPAQKRTCITQKQRRNPTISALLALYNTTGIYAKIPGLTYHLFFLNPMATT